MRRWRRARGASFRTLEDYYRRTASGYERGHAHELRLYYVALRHMVTYLDWLGAKTVLDTGCGTGKVLELLHQARPHLALYGNDLSTDLLRLAGSEGNQAPGRLLRATTERLPFADDAFDVVIETEILHHLPRPADAIAEMLRVARQAVFLWDTNMYGHGGIVTGVAKLLLARARLLRPINRLRRGGHDWFCSEGDGLAYSYSVIDAYPQLRQLCSDVTVIATDGRPGAGAWPLLRGHHLLVCGFKRSLPSDWPLSLPAPGERVNMSEETGP